MSPLSLPHNFIHKLVTGMFLALFFLLPSAVTYAQFEIPGDFDLCGFIRCGPDGLPIFDFPIPEPPVDEGMSFGDPPRFTGVPDTLALLARNLTSQQYSDLIAFTGSADRINEVFQNGGTVFKLAGLVRENGTISVANFLRQTSALNAGNILSTRVNVNVSDLGDLIDEVGGFRIEQLLDLPEFGSFDLDNILNLDVNVGDFGKLLGSVNLDDFGDFFDKISLDNLDDILDLDINFGDFGNFLANIDDFSGVGDLFDGLSFDQLEDVFSLDINFGQLGGIFDNLSFDEFASFTNGLDASALTSFFKEVPFTDGATWIKSLGGTDAATAITSILGDGEGAIGSLVGSALGKTFGTGLGVGAANGLFGQGCQGIDIKSILAAARAAVTSALATGVSGISGAISVPVFDASVIAQLSALNTTASTISSEAAQINANTDSIANTNASIDCNVEVIKDLTQELRDKELGSDIQLHRGWATLIGTFVSQTQKFITTGYNGNPAFLTNQYIYYQLVSLSAARTFAEDIAISDIERPTQRTILRSILDGLFDSPFPYLSGDGTTLAESVAPDQLANDFYGEGGGWAGFNNFFASTEENESAVVSIALSDLSRRITTQLEFEKQKLDWGRGFFSYEICDLAIFSGSSLDRRNCRIATPGALIQEQTTFVFGSALRQMEINDEFEEWIAPNTLAVLSDTLSFRTLTSEVDSRNSISSQPASPRNVATAIDLESMPDEGESNGDGLLPWIFDFDHIGELQGNYTDGIYLGSDNCDRSNSLDPNCSTFGVGEAQFRRFIDAPYPTIK